MIATWIAVALGGACGAVLRYTLTGWLGQALGTTFPWATFAINASGSFLLAFTYTVLLQTTVSPILRTAIGSGLIGAYTTFSTLTWEALELMRENRLRAAAAYVAASVVVGIAAAWLGYGLGQNLRGRVP